MSYNVTKQAGGCAGGIQTPTKSCALVTTMLDGNVMHNLLSHGQARLELTMAFTAKQDDGSTVEAPATTSQRPLYHFLFFGFDKD